MFRLERSQDPRLRGALNEEHQWSGREASLTKRCNGLDDVGCILLYNISPFFGFNPMTVLSISLTDLAHSHCGSLIIICLLPRTFFPFPLPFCLYFPGYKVDSLSVFISISLSAERFCWLCTCILCIPRALYFFHQSTGSVTGLLATSLGQSPGTKYLEGECHIDFYASLYI